MNWLILTNGSGQAQCPQSCFIYSIHGGNLICIYREINWDTGHENWQLIVWGVQVKNRIVV